MRCQDFMERYSDFADGMLGDADAAVCESHMRECRSCEDYHDVMRRALAQCRTLPRVKPSEDFLDRLQHRLYHVDDAGKLSARNHLGSAALIAVATVGFLAVTWLPFATQMSFEVELPPVAVEAPVPVPAAASLFESRSPAFSVTNYWVPLRPSLDAAPSLFDGEQVPVQGPATDSRSFESSLRPNLDGSR